MEALLLPFLAIFILLAIWLISNSAGSGFLGFASGSAQETPTPIVSATLPATWTVTNTLPPLTGTPQPTRPTATSLIPDIPPRFPIATETPRPGPILPPTATRTPNFAATQTAFWDDYWATQTAAWDEFWATETAMWIGEGTAAISPSTVLVSSTGNTLVIVFKVGGSAFTNGWVDLVIPAGWSLPSDNPADPGYTEVTAYSGGLYLTGALTAPDTFSVYVPYMAAGGSITIEYGSKSGGGPGAIAPSTIGTSVFNVFSNPNGPSTLLLANPPKVQVVAPATPSNTPTPSDTPTPSNTPTDTPTSTHTPTPTDIPGEGSASILPAIVSVGSTGNTLAIEYRPGATSFTNGRIEIAIPAGWSPPSTTQTAAGYTLVTFSTGATGLTWGVAGSTFYVSIGSLDAATGIIRVQYGVKSQGGPGATAPGAAEISTFEVSSDPTGISVLPIAVHPTVQVAEPTATPTASNTPTVTSTPSDTPTPSITPTPSNTPDPSETPTVTSTPSNTPTATPIAGQGSVLVVQPNPAEVEADSSDNHLIFDFSAGTTAFENGEIEVHIPTTWSPPSAIQGEPGYVFVSGSPGTSNITWDVIGNVIYVHVGGLSTGSAVVRVNYGVMTQTIDPGAIAPPAPETSTFLVYSDPLGSAVAPMANPPQIEVVLPGP